MIAIIISGGKQYKVRESQILRVEKIPESSRRENRVTFPNVLLTADDTGNVSVGTPFVPNASVEATIVRDDRAKKIRVVKYKAKTRYKRVYGHRQPFTEVRIDRIIA